MIGQRSLQYGVVLTSLFCAAALRADYSPPRINPNSQQNRLAEKKEKLRQQQEELFAQQDRLYNEINTRPPHQTYIQKYAWTVIIVIVLAAVVMRLLLDRRFRGPAYDPGLPFSNSSDDRLRPPGGP